MRNLFIALLAFFFFVPANADWFKDTSSKTLNESSVTGATVTDALNSLSYMDGIDITPNSIHIKGNDAITLDDTVWNDLKVPINAVKLEGSKDPDYAKAFDNGSGSQGVFVYFFDDSAEEEVYFVMQIPHDYKYETDLHPHVHWFPKSNGNPAEVVSWGIEYCWKEIGSNYTTTRLIYGNVHTPADASLVANRHYLSELTVISGTGIDTVSSMLICRLFRDATGAGATDDYGADVGLLEVDFHYQIDTIGSRTEYAK